MFGSHPKRIAFLGPRATFSHLAALRHFGDKVTPVPCATICAVLSEVEKGKADYGVVPVENSTDGMVFPTLDALLDSRLTIQAETVVPVEHCLLANQATPLTAIRRVYSHPHALNQCHTWLRSHLPKAVLVDSPSTAEAARSVRRNAVNAAVASKLAAVTYGLAVLVEKIQDTGDNRTRFLVIGNRRPDESRDAKSYTTSVALTGNLANMLAPVTEAGVKLIRIQSRPLRKRAWYYVYFLDLEGRASEPAMSRLLSVLTLASGEFRLLGSYPVFQKKPIRAEAHPALWPVLSPSPAG
jgi:chorismate mutase/prephenate dehydratase